MARYAHLSDTKNDAGYHVVENVSASDPETASERGLIEITQGGPGWWYDDSNGTFLPPVGSLAEERANKIEELSRERDNQINAGVSYTFPDGRTGLIPTEVPNQVSRLTTLYVRAERAERKGESVTFDITTNDDKDFALSPSEMATMGDAATDAGQAVHRKWQEHRNNVLALSDPRDVLAYDTGENGGWP